MSIPEQLVKYARQIAIYRAYPVLENGLQPLNDYEVNGITHPGLNSKFEHEQQTLAEAVASGDVWHVYHEAADLLYYAACMDAQIRIGYGEPNMSNYGYYNCSAIIADACLYFQKAEKAALAKYAWRSAAPGNKDEDFEIELIRQAIN